MNLAANPSRDLLAVTFAIFFPTLVTAVYFLWLEGTSWVPLAYGIGKCIQFVFPIIFVWLYYREKLPSFSKRRSGFESAVDNRNLEDPLYNKLGKFNLLLGLLFGLGVVAGMVLVFFAILPKEITSMLTATAGEKVNAMGIDTLAKYLLLMAFYVVFHSLLEEYYWRWFVYDILQKQVPSWLAKVISSLGFMAHHIVLLTSFFGWGSPFAWLFSGSVAVGGMFWCWQFDRPWGFRSAWLSHAMVDAGIFGLGIYILRNGGTL